jgi:hypothetical protein
MKFVELRMLHQDAKADHVVKAGWLATLPRDMSKVLENLVMPPILEIPLDPHMAGDVLEVVAVILKHLKGLRAAGKSSSSPSSTLSWPFALLLFYFPDVTYF